MNWLPTIGSTCLGLFVAYLTGMFLRKISPDKFTFDGYKVLISTASGGGVDGFFALITKNIGAVWYYPIGLVVGFIIYILVSVLIFKEPPGKVAFGKIIEKR